MWTFLHLGIFMSAAVGQGKAYSALEIDNHPCQPENLKVIAHLVGIDFINQCFTIVEGH
jgi:hypothetical protein